MKIKTLILSSVMLATVFIVNAQVNSYSEAIIIQENHPIGKGTIYATVNNSFSEEKVEKTNAYDFTAITTKMKEMNGHGWEIISSDFDFVQTSSVTMIMTYVLRKKEN